MIELFEKFISLLIPKVVFGGLEISDSAIRFVSIKSKASFSMRLPPGLIVNGRIKDRNSAASALKAIKNQIEPQAKKKTNIVFVVPSGAIYTQAFQLPYVAKDTLESAVEFNLKMLSPLRQEAAYSDWQLIGETSDQLEVLAAFAPAAVIDEYVSAATEAGFKILAIEFPSLSMVRLIKSAGAAVDLSRPYIVLNLFSEGLDFMIMKNGNLYFDYFQPWKTDQNGARQIKWSDFQETVVREVRRIFNYYNTHWGKVEDFLLISPEFYDRLAALISGSFGLKVQTLSLRGYGGVTVPWFIALGGALRADISRSRDDEISLMGTSVREQYFREELLVLVGLWRNITAAVIAFAIIASLATLFIIGRVQNFAEANWRNASGIGIDTETVDRLKMEAQQFNRLVNLIGEVRAGRIDWVAIFDKLLKVGGPRVIIERISIPSVNNPISISGTALNESSVFELERNLAAQTEFANVQLPIASIKRTVAGRWAFEITFSLKEVFFLK